MKPNQKVIADAVRIEYTEHDGALFLVFEITDEQFKKEIKENWTKDLEYKIINKSLVRNE